MYWRTMMVPQWRRAVFIAVASSLFSTVAQALGVGELKVYSALDEPLEAEILLAPTGTKEIKTLQARLVARPDFDVATDATAPISREIRVTVTQRRDGQHLLKLYSEQPVREPYLRFLLQLDWAGGRLTREFVALIDPAEFRPVGAASVDDTGAETALATTAEPPAAEAQPAPPAEAVTVTAPPPASAASGPAAKPGPASISVSGPPDAGPDSPTQGAEAAVPTPTTAAARKTGPKKQVVVNEPSKITQRNADEQRQRLASEIEAWAKTRKQVRSEDETTRRHKPRQAWYPERKNRARRDKRCTGHRR
jgi:pilus assembly protein FimV